MIVLFGEFNHWYVPFWIFVFDDLVFQFFFLNLIRVGEYGMWGVFCG